MYYIIKNSDGDTTVDAINKTELLKRIKEGYYGGTGVFKDLPSQRDTNYWGENLLIIKGTIVEPKPVETVTEYDID